MAGLTVHGADLSHHNPTPDLKKAKKAGLQWLIHKATEGSTYTDSTYTTRRRLAAAAGIKFGGYAFARPDAGSNDAKLEALHAFKVINPVAGDIVPALDFEVHAGGAEAWCKTWQAEMARLLRTRGLISDRLLHYGPDDFGSDYPAVRWVPRYNNSNIPPKVPYDIFQFSNGVYGNPNSFAGLGHVDLNYMKPGFDINQLILKPIRKPISAPAPKSQNIKILHASLQFSDTEKQKIHDAEAIFARAVKTKVSWVTGTESGEEPLISIVRRAADKYGYRVHNKRGNWVAVRKDIIKAGSWKAGEVYVEDNDKVVGPGHDSTFAWVSFTHKDEGIGDISIAAIHYPTRGQTSKDPNNWVNMKYAKALGQWGQEKGKGKALVFIGGDFNMPTGRTRPDVFFDNPFTTLSDELGVFPNTGHGPIDHIATYDKDARVSALTYRAFPDSKFFLNSDHFLIEGKVKVGLV